ncbi:MAG TPA: hypothetical protein VE994_13960 [Terriglobales bacterium]|nr:hypothetical protein [Terriglobales bacterium]
MANDKDQFSSKGAVEQDAPGETTNENMPGQLGHRDQDPMLKSSDTDFPEPGNNEEHTGEPNESTAEAKGPRNRRSENPEHVGANQDPGHRQKRN